MEKFNNNNNNNNRKVSGIDLDDSASRRADVEELVAMVHAETESIPFVWICFCGG